MWPVTLPISPVAASHSRGIASSSFIGPAFRYAETEDAAGRRSSTVSLDHQDLGVRRQQRLREHVVKGEDRGEGQHDRLVDRAPDALGAAGGGYALVAADDRDDRAVDGGLQDRAPAAGGRALAHPRP